MFNTRSGSYGLKHEAETFARGYLANGMLNRSRLALGFKETANCAVPPSNAR
jgi:hypothetical protein